MFMIKFLWRRVLLEHHKIIIELFLYVSNLKQFINYMSLFRRPFAVVQFPDEGNTLAIIASSWLISTEQQGIYLRRWPLSNAEKATKKLKNPGADWSTYKAKLIHSSSK